MKSKPMKNSFKNKKSIDELDFNDSSIDIIFNLEQIKILL